MHGSLGLPESAPKRHLDRFSRFCRAHERDHATDSDVTTRGPVRQLPQGAWRRGRLEPTNEIFCFVTEFQKTEISKKSKLNDNDEIK